MLAAVLRLRAARRRWTRGSDEVYDVGSLARAGGA
jgi:hypothetical protein